MVRIVVLLTLLSPALVLWFTRRKTFPWCALTMVGVQVVLTLLYILTNGLTVHDFFTGDSHGTITLLFIYISDVLAVLLLIFRAIWDAMRRGRVDEYTEIYETTARDVEEETDTPDE